MGYSKVESINDRLFIRLPKKLINIKITEIGTIGIESHYFDGSHSDYCAIHTKTKVTYIEEADFNENTLSEIEEAIKKYYRSLEPKKVMI